MSDISLRAYHRKIENWIEENNLDKAISQSAYLIGIFPKVLCIWQSLSKALLQKQDFSNAESVFDLILKVKPDDFVSHIGKSMVAESRHSLDEAITHMQRAFEIEPANEGLQNELKRLTAKHEGVAPGKVRLTRGALIKMYLRGGLFEQAIAEAELGICESPTRVDYQIALAQSAQNSGDLVKAVDTAVSILSKLPYCQKANEILFEILRKSPKEELSIGYYHRLTRLDPYFAYMSENTPSVLDVPDIAVMVADQSNMIESVVDFGQLIAASWLDTDEPEDQLVEFSEPDWENVISKAIQSPQISMNLDDEKYDEILENPVISLAGDSGLSGSRKEVFLGKLRSTSHRNPQESVLPEWMFDQEGQLIRKEALSEPSELSTDDLKNLTEESVTLPPLDDDVLIADQNEPVFSDEESGNEPPSRWVLEEDGQVHDEPVENTVSLNDTQPIKIPADPPEPLLDIAEKAIAGENYQFAIRTLRKIIQQKEYLPAVISRLEEISEAYPQNSDFLLLLGEFYTRDGRRDEALAAYRRAQKIISL